MTVPSQSHSRCRLTVYWMTTRRRAVIALGLNALAIGTRWSPAGAAPPRGKVLRLGLLYGLREKFEPESNSVDRALAEGLRAYGYQIGRNVTLEFRSAAGTFERLPELAAELAQLKVDILIALGESATRAAHKATNTIPIVMVGIPDPVATGLAASLSRPGGNFTGLALNATDIAAKRVQLLKEAVPKLSRVAVLWNSSFKSMELQFQKVEIAAPTLGISVLSLRVQSGANFDEAFAAILKARPDGMIVLFGPMRGSDLPRIVEFVNANHLPTIFELDRGVRGGGLMEFGPSFADLAGQVGFYVDKIANGASPADLPIQEPTRFEFVVNLSAARKMGLTLPATVLNRADRLVE